MSDKTNQETVGEPVSEKQAEVSSAPPKKPKRKRIIVIVAVLAVVVIGIFLFSRLGTPTAAAAAEYVTGEVERRNITVTLSGSGTLEPLDSYSVSGLVSGEILEAPFEEGDVLKEGDLLYRIDPKNAEDNIQTAEDNLENAQTALEKAEKTYKNLVEDKAEYDKNRAKSIADLTLTTKDGGQVVTLHVDVGDTVAAGMAVAEIQDTNNLTLELPFLQDDIAGIHIGDRATVTLSDFGEVLTGRVDSLSGVTVLNSYGVATQNITIAITNAGGLTEGTQATAVVGDAACNDGGTLSYKTNTTLKATVGGKVEYLYVKEGQTVASGGRVYKLETSDDTAKYDRQLETALDNIEDAKKTVARREDSLQKAIDVLDDYTITSNIDGTVIEKNFKEGDSVSLTGTAAGGMAIIYDLSGLSFIMNIDELDIGQIQVGQNVVVTAEALPGQVYKAVVTRVSVKGTTVGGVTSYPVTIEMIDFEGLLPGMNISAEIAVTYRENVLAVPTSAVQRGNRVLKLIDPNATAAAPGEDNASVPPGYEYVTVVIGETDNSFIEIVEGLSEGDTYTYAKAVIVPSNNFYMQQGGGPAGGPGDGPRGETVVVQSNGGGR